MTGAQAIRRVARRPSLDQGAYSVDWFLQLWNQHLLAALAQINDIQTLLQNQIQSFRPTPLGNGVGGAVIQLPTAFPDSNYSWFLTPNWNTTVYENLAPTPTQFSVTFGNVSANGGVMMVLAVR